MVAVFFNEVLYYNKVAFHCDCICPALISYPFEINPNPLNDFKRWLAFSCLVYLLSPHSLL